MKQHCQIAVAHLFSETARCQVSVLHSADDVEMNSSRRILLPARCKVHMKTRRQGATRADLQEVVLHGEGAPAGRQHRAVAKVAREEVRVQRGGHEHHLRDSPPNLHTTLFQTGCCLHTQHIKDQYFQSSIRTTGTGMSTQQTHHMTSFSISNKLQHARHDNGPMQNRTL